jgi:hypothetical protein
MIMLSGVVCNCGHTHVYGGIQYLDCPYCDCHEHSSDSVDTLKVYNVKRFNSWVRKHERPKRIKQASMIDREIQQMIASIELV